MSDIQTSSGEALPSIASVSTLVLTTGTEDGQLTEIIVGKDPKRSAEKSVAGPEAQRSESGEPLPQHPGTAQVFENGRDRAFCLCRGSFQSRHRGSQIAFTLRHHNSVLVKLRGQYNQTAVAEIWGREVARALVPIDLFNGTARVTELVSPPHFTKPTQLIRWFFVNSRPVKNRTPHCSRGSSLSFSHS
ncbi:MAG: hypothetical protein R2688_04605 [Fimbriimonadaceae bacterium]